MTGNYRLTDYLDVPPPPRKARHDLMTYAATDLDAPPRYHGSNKVHCRGERLARVIWKGSQWAVTTFGIECRDGTYHISKTSLWDDEADFGWIRHMDEKGWVDIEDFAEALRIARGRFVRSRQ